MKRKLTSAILAIMLMLSMSAPAFAACSRSPVCGMDGGELLRQILCRYAGWCGGSVVTETPRQQKPSAPARTEPLTEPQTPDSAASPEAPAEPEAAVTANAYEQEVIRLVNAERAKYGLAALTEDVSLTRTARMKSQDMHDNRYFDHNSPIYGTPFQLMKSQGVTYRTAGENIAMGYATPQAVVSAWMNSSGHRANILNASYTRIGVGYVENGNYWTQHFAG